MKYLKRFGQLNESNESIESICLKYDIKNYHINGDGSVDVDGDVNLSYKKLTHLPLKFGRVTGGFDCSKNQLISLEGAPSEVEGGFYCYNNQLTTLMGGPKEVGGCFNCSNNQLTSLEGGPKSVSGSFYDCNENQLITLVGGPERVSWDFYCTSNKLINLEGSPKSIGNSFFCDKNRLVSLIGISEIGGIFYCSDNPVEIIISYFHSPNSDVRKKFFEKINHIYTDLWLGDGWTIQGDILEQIAEDLGVYLPEDWRNQVESFGYNVI